MDIKTKPITVLVALCAVALFFSVFSLERSPFSDEDSGAFIITSNSHTQQSPAIYGNIVIWEDNRNGNKDIYGYNLETREEFPIITNSGNQQCPAIYGDIVVWKDSRKGRNAIYGYNLLTHEEFFLSISSHQLSPPAIYGTIVVWEDYSSDTPGIYGINLSTYEPFQISADPDKQRWPAVYSNIIVWADERGGKDTIYGHNISTSEEFQIGTAWGLLSSRLCQHEPALYGDIIVWTNTSHIIYGYSLKTQREFKIARTHVDKCDISTRVDIDRRRPAIYSNIVVWTDCRSGNPDIYGFNLTTNEEFQVTTSKYCQKEPAIYNTIVVWCDNRNGNWDIYGADISEPLVVPVSSRTLLVFVDHSPLCLVIVFIAVSAFCTGRAFWFTHTIISKATPKRDFRREKPSNRISVIYAVFFPLHGLIFFIFIHPSWGLALFSISILFIIDSFWLMKTPYIRITNDEIMILPNIISGPKRVELDHIQDIDFRVEDKILLLLKNDKKVEIKLSHVHKDEDLHLIKALKKIKETDEASKIN